MLLRSTEFASEGNELILGSTEVATEGTKVLLRSTGVATEGTELILRNTEGYISIGFYQLKNLLNAWNCSPKLRTI